MPARAARLPLRFGGLGLRGAVADRHAAYWASWMDTLPVIHTRAPGIAARLLALLRDPSAGHLPSLTAAVQAAAYLHTQGFEAPAWGEAFVDHAVPTDREDGEPEDFLRGWQRRAARACDEARVLETHLPELTTRVPSVAALASWAPCCAGLHRPPPTWDEFTRAQSALPGSAPSPLAPARCRSAPSHCSCRGTLDAYGDHRAALRHVGCPSFAGLASGARPSPRVCQEAGARVGPKCQAGGHEPPRAGPRRPTHRGRLQRGCRFGMAHKWPLTPPSSAPSHVTELHGPVLTLCPALPSAMQASRKRRQTYPELSRSRRCRLVSRVRRRGGRALGDGSRILPPHARARVRGGEYASCAPPRCAKRMGSAMERYHHSVGCARSACRVAPRAARRSPCQCCRT